uniref:FBA_2 domain-containing protein n=1 Tax=Steinernema glaseri TaxID=37863 RepID=A0A1I8AN47_9BILA
MDAVPQIFMESVCLSLDRDSLRASRYIYSTWGTICYVTSKKVHTLRVLLDGEEKKIYAAAEPPRLYDTYRIAASLDSVDLKFVTNIRIETRTTYDSPQLTNNWKEITLDRLQRLVRFIAPTKNERHPLRYDPESLNSLSLKRGSEWINRKILSLGLPVDSVNLEVSKEEAMEFFETAGLLYFVRYVAPNVEQSIVDTIIEKFVPIDDGSFSINNGLNRAQMNKLFKKCVLSDKKVKVTLTLEFSTNSIALTHFFDYDKYYSEKEVLRQGMEVRCANRGEARLKLQVRLIHVGWIEWLWDDANEPWRV